ncbi:hypothetical protein GeomeDRAFT_3351 [Geobacter metallireducens RCH3]|uniref:Cytochrome c n=1 Tax=Geobacter metallireducens (strain ATCC 53774 / DSM 7210 / GS-15) TaxID=269799 RepID=Q39Y30_GEOMG|nr:MULTISPECIES: hypothetical protein [Geobacter]ABB30844.1 cytochrome c [Geobacter metallireducens GS-15]EHP83919.1 hypothetical protein GeomeDRAFT_3351 [Geobacter metallireducens RCH3]MBT1076328.1 cytochrome C [Geobacter grbiciae]
MKRIGITFIALLALAAPAMAGHVATIGTGTCGSCHRTNLVTQHGGFVATVCQTCHDSTVAAVKDTIATGVAGQPYTCSNCHGAETHLSKHGDYAANFAAYNGVEPVTSGIWTAPSSYTKVTPATKEYQVCVKCHSSNGLGSTTNSVSGVTGPSGLLLTDQAMEFSQYNRSGHPIVTGLNNYPNSPAPKALVKTQLSSPWNVNMGKQTMKCFDCHGADGKLVGVGRDWPYNSATGQLWKLGDASNSKLFCKNCHPLVNTNNTHSESNHSKYPCVYCHTRVPHGGKVSRLIVTFTSGLPSRYYPDGKGGGTPSLQDKLLRYTKATSASRYDTPSCDADCHGSHQNTTGEAW